MIVINAYYFLPREIVFSSTEFTYRESLLHLVQTFLIYITTVDFIPSEQNSVQLKTKMLTCYLCGYFPQGTSNS